METLEVVVGSGGPSVEEVMGDMRVWGCRSVERRRALVFFIRCSSSNMWKPPKSSPGNAFKSLISRTS